MGLVFILDVPSLRPIVFHAVMFPKFRPFPHALGNQMLCRCAALVAGLIEVMRIV